jgi:anti-sigma B factor antagonist
MKCLLRLPLLAEIESKTKRESIMKITTRTEGEIRVIALQGKIISSQDTAELQQEIRKVIEDNVKKVVLDLTGLEWMNSTGLGALVAVMGRLRNVDGHLRLAHLNEMVNSLMTLNKLNLVFDIHPTVEAAIAGFR